MGFEEKFFLFIRRFKLIDDHPSVGGINRDLITFFNGIENS